MELVSPKDLVNANAALRVFGGVPLARILIRLLKIDVINREYGANIHLPPHEFLDKILGRVQISYHVPDTDLKNIPVTGQFITISNHAYGGIDGLILLSLITKVRPDYKVLVNFLLTQIHPLKKYFIGVNPFETHKDVKSSYGGLKDAFLHMLNGHPLGIFPAGEVSSYKLKRRAVTDREWQHSMLKFIKKSRIPIIPVYFSGHNSIFFNILGFFHPVLRTARLPSELLNKQGREIQVRIGSQIGLEEQDLFKDFSDFGKFLRMKTYSLGLAEKPEKVKYKEKYKLLIHTPEPLADPVADDLVIREIEEIKQDHLLFRLKENYVFCVETFRIPNIMREIGRRREKSYREVGEGTGKGYDIDQFDAYFNQLFIWDDAEKQLVGGYRIGKGNRILTEYGLKGFYIASLFKIEKKFVPILNISLELGRSFIIKEYQKKTLSLFLLWKGILYLLLKNPNYRYLIGPVSISNEFRSFSKTLCVEFLRANYFNSEFASFVKAKNPFIIRRERIIEKDILLRYTENDVGRLDRFIHDFDPSYKTPILLKKYLSVNAEVMGFNVDPLFNNCLDALMILDLFEVPPDTIEGLAKELGDQSILERFRK